MAITLDELLGRSRADVPEDIAADRFPSYGGVHRTPQH